MKIHLVLLTTLLSIGVSTEDGTESRYGRWNYGLRTENIASKGTIAGVFPEAALVRVKGKGSMLMRDIKLGDEVLVDSEHFEPVYSFGHFSPEAEGNYIRLIPSKLELSPNHLVFVEKKGAIPASLVRVGDVLVGGQEVSEIQSVFRKGMYAPFTPSGKIMVNGVQASTFTSLQNGSTFVEIAHFPTPISYQWLAETIEVPHRLYCMYISSCTGEKYTEDGISAWLAPPFAFLAWMMEQEREFSSLLASTNLTDTVYLLMIVLSASAILVIASTSAECDKNDVLPLRKKT